MLRRAHLILVLGLALAGLPAELSAQPRAVGAADDPVVAAAGDIACDPADAAFNGGTGRARHCHQLLTSNLLVAGGFDAVLALGDEQYECGGYLAFLQSYDPTWGRVKAITRPVPGNHEYYRTGGTDCGRRAAGYFQYFGPAAGTSKGYYSFRVGTWRFIALNSNCSIVSCKAGERQERWLASTLASHPARCTVAFFHHPRFASGAERPHNARNLLPFWKDLYEARADLVLNGHHHFYERFERLDPGGHPDPRGIREFIVGTGGKSLGKPTIAHAGSEFRDGAHFGILELTLHPSGYDWAFVAEDGTAIDAGSDTCVA